MLRRVLPACSGWLPGGGVLTLPAASQLAAVPALILLAVATVQISLAKGGLLSPWKGGGFGMFASLDGGSNRNLKVLASAEGRTRQLEIPASLELEARKAELHPTDRRLDALAKRLGRHESAHGQETHELRVEARRVDYAPRTLDPTWVLLNARSVALGQGASDTR